MITRAKLVRWLVIVVLLGGVFLIVRYTRDKPSPEPPARVSIGISATSLLPALIHIADSKGFFRGEGLDVEIEGYPTGKAALAATLNGEVDMGTVADIPIVSNSFERMTLLFGRLSWILRNTRRRSPGKTATSVRQETCSVRQLLHP